MKQIRIVFALMLLMVALISCKTEPDKASGKIISKQLPVTNYDEIEINVNANVVYESKSEVEPYLMVEGDDNLISVIEAKVEGSKLILTQTANVRPTRMIIFTNSPSLKRVIHKGSADLHLKGTISGNQFIFEQEGIGNLTADNLLFYRTQLVLKGSGNAIISGKADKASYSLIGVGALSAKDMIVEDLDCHLIESGYMLVNAQKTLNVNIKGNGTVEYAGYPQSLTKILEGVGTVTPISE